MSDHSEAGPRANRPLNVLVVEDEPMIQEIIRVFLTDAGHQVAAAANGKAGLEKFLQGKFDLVLTDNAMPIMSGEEMVREIKRQAPHVPIVLLTGSVEIDRPPPGVKAVLRKPVTMNMLLKTVEEATSGPPPS